MREGLQDDSNAGEQRENRGAYQRIWFRPRILRDVTNIDFESTILGHKVRTASVWPSRERLTVVRIFADDSP